MGDTAMAFWLELSQYVSTIKHKNHGIDTIKQETLGIKYIKQETLGIKYIKQETLGIKYIRQGLKNMITIQVLTRDNRARSCGLINILVLL